MSVLGVVVNRVDSWVNAMTGLGTLRDKLTHAQIIPGDKLADPTLEALYNDDDLARRLVNKIPREATRRGFKITLEGTEDDNSADRARELMDRWNALSATPKLREAWIWGRLYAGGAVLVGADDGLDPAMPLDESAIAEIRFLTVLKRPQLRIKQRYSDIAQPKYGEPELFEIWAPRDGTGGALQETGTYVHESRLIIFDGVKAARTYRTSSDGWEDSVLQAVNEQLKHGATAWQSVAHLLSDASQGVLSIHGLIDMIAAKGEDLLRTRIQMMDLARSVCRSILLDAEKEKFERVATSFAGIPEIMDRQMMRVAAAFEMPVTILFGRSPAGLNATGESDIRGWYDTVGDEQSDTLKPRMERLLKLLMMTKNSPTGGKVPERWEIVFLPLWQPTEKEHADVLKIKADTHVALVTGEIMFAAEAALSLAADFPAIDQEHRQALLDADLDEELRPGQVPGGDDDPEGGDDDPADDDDPGQKPTKKPPKKNSKPAKE